MHSLLVGLATGLSLIVAIGAQNAFVLRQGVRRSHVGAVVAVCALSDALLIAAGVGGLGVVVESAGWVLDVVRWLGVAFLVGYAVLALRGAARGGGQLREAEGAAQEGRRGVVLKAVALTWLNPHVYLDTVLLLGSIAATQGGAADRWAFGAGAMAASLLWFTGLGFGARLLAPLLARPRAWQVLDVFVALTMLAVAAKLALG
ncbi:LysE/ArgO family amino acid transporter [Nocardioides sp.]|uniref:LysE/ArgO family amino acid transporter n=1 Tax=Nocardioides sp. TaxID=35761 RepID=UPI003518688B